MPTSLSGELCSQIKGSKSEKPQPISRTDAPSKLLYSNPEAVITSSAEKCQIQYCVFIFY